MKVRFLLECFVFFIFCSGLAIFQGALADELPELEKFLAKVKTLVQKYYPNAKVTVASDEIDFEDLTMEFTVHHLGKDGNWSIPFTVKGPQRGGWRGSGGIVGRIKLWPGPYVFARARPNTVDYRYYKELLLAPYSEKYQCHLLADLLYPDTADPVFVKTFTDLVNVFEADLE